MTAHVLIIEDNLANMELAEYLLKAAGYEPSKAYDGSQGLQLIKEERPDLILCDLQMPVMDGYEVLKNMRADAAIQGITIVAVTALSMPGDKFKVMAAGFDGYLSKPIDPEKFVAQLEAYLPLHLLAASQNKPS